MMPPSWAGTVGVLTPRPTPPSDTEALLPTRAAADPYAGSNWEDHRLRVCKADGYFVIRVKIGHGGGTEQRKTGVGCLSIGT